MAIANTQKEISKKSVKSQPGGNYVRDFQDGVILLETCCHHRGSLQLIDPSDVVVSTMFGWISNVSA